MQDVIVFEVFVRWTARGKLECARQFPDGQFRQARSYASDLFDCERAYFVQVKENAYRGHRQVSSIVRVFLTMEGHHV